MSAVMVRVKCLSPLHSFNIVIVLDTMEVMNV